MTMRGFRMQDAASTGFSLLELLVATSFFCVILLAGYAAVDSQSFLCSLSAERTRPEEESNYRILVLKNLLQESTAAFRQDPLTAEIPYFFPDLNFGQSQEEDHFSVAVPARTPLRFIRNTAGNLLVPARAPLLQTEEVVAQGGSCGERFCWSFARIDSTTLSQGVQELQVSAFLTGETPQIGSLIAVELHGFEFRNNILYWISPSGTAEPFWGPLDEFQYEQNNHQLTLSWKTGLLSGRSVIDL